MQIQIYGLYDVRKPDEIKYVGRTSNIQSRFKNHLRGDDNATRVWAAEVRQSGGVMGMKLLETVDALQADLAERKWISAIPGVINKTKVIEAPKVDFILADPIPIEELKLIYLDWAMARFGGNKLVTSKALKIGRQTLYNMLSRKV